MSTDFWFQDFCAVCEVNFQTTFRESLWFPSLLVMSQSVNKNLFLFIYALKMGPTAAFETSSGSLCRTTCKNPKTKKSVFTFTVCI